MLIAQTIAEPAARLAAAPFDTPDMWDEVVASVRAEYMSEVQDYPWIIGFSGGKDSTVVAQAVFEALLQVPPSRRKRHVHVVSNDTQVESPLVMAHLAKVQTALREMTESLRLPVTVVTTRPAADKTFWTLLIGKGYPSPNQTMRWCTDRLKIQPTSRYILDRTLDAKSRAKQALVRFSGS